MLVPVLARVSDERLSGPGTLEVGDEAVRTGRAGNKGTCVTFITPEQDKYAIDVLKALQASNAPVPKELEEMAKGTCHEPPGPRRVTEVLTSHLYSLCGQGQECPGDGHYP